MTGIERNVITRERAALAVVFAVLLSAGVAHVARGDGCLSAADAASALRCDEHLAALAASTTLCTDATPAPDAGEVSAAAGERIAGAARAARAVRAARAIGSPALHTATPARPLHRRLHHGALAPRHAGRRRTTPELLAHREAVQPVGTAPVPAAPARESHPRAALPVLVRPAHQVSWGGGGRVAATAPRASWALPVSATAVAAEEDVRVPDAGHEPHEARGPPEVEPLRPIPPAPTRSPSSLPRVRSSSSTSLTFAPAHPAHETGGGTCVSPAAGEPDRRPGGRTHLTLFDPALPLGRADARRMESATAFPSRLSAGGVS